MKVYTYSKARQQLAKLLDEVQQDGQVQIKRRDGQRFIVQLIQDKRSPLDIPGVTTNLSLDELNEVVKESRERL